MTTAVSRVEVVRVEREHLPALTEFYRRVWSPDATLPQVEADRAAAALTNPANPGAPPPTWLVLHAGHAIAHLTTIPIRIWLGGSNRPAHWLKGLWVLPEHQRSAAGFLVLKAAVAALDGVSLALVHEPAAIRLFKALGVTDLGALPNRLRLLRARALLGRLNPDTLGLGGLPSWTRAAMRLVRPTAPVLGPCIDGITALWARAAGGTLGALTMEITPECDRAGADALWAAVRLQLEAGSVRSGEYLSRRYGRGSEYSFVHVRARGTLVGIGVVKRPRADGDPRLSGIRIATLSDIVCAPDSPGVGLEVLRGAERAARQFGADALLCGVSHWSLQPLTRRRGYFKLPANLRVLARSVHDDEPLPGQLRDWWVTRGDSEGDGTF